MTKRILITGGPVHAFLDSVKIITNRFKGGLMVDLAERFVRIAEETGEDIQMTYLCSKDAKQPNWDKLLGKEHTKLLTCMHHNGIDDYMEKVLGLAPMMDAVVLGAAVANLIPKKKLEGKFPSHNYKEGDTIPIDFTIAPRIIDRVKKVAPRTQLFGFKLLSNTSVDDLISAAYGVLLESKATAVFANDTANLMQKYAVGRDNSVNPIPHCDVPSWILKRLDDIYYSTNLYAKNIRNEHLTDIPNNMQKLIDDNKNNFIYQHDMFFGAVAEKHPELGFFTTGRGKQELDSIVYVADVDHVNKRIHVVAPTKASLNAPLFNTIFENYPQVKTILHFHHQHGGIPAQEWYPPGTVGDSQREGASFNIKGHGCILSYDEQGEMVK